MLTESEVEQLTEKLNILVEDKVNELVDEKKRHLKFLETFGLSK